MVSPADGCCALALVAIPWRRERALKVVLLLLGLLFCAAVCPLLLIVKEDPALVFGTR